MKLELFNHEKFGKIRITGRDGKPYFIAKDVAIALGYSDTTQAIRKHCKGVVEITAPSKGGNQLTKIIPESDVYRLVMRSKLPTAEVFQDWVCEEVLPQIRKTGNYAPAVQLPDFNDPVAAARAWADTKEEQLRLTEEVAALKPDAEFGRDLKDSKSIFTITQVAKPLGISAKRLNKFLKQKKVIFGDPNRNDGDWFPCADYDNTGYFKMVGRLIQARAGQRTRHQLKVTGEGRAFIHALWNKNQPMEGKA